MQFRGADGFASDDGSTMLAGEERGLSVSQKEDVAVIRGDFGFVVLPLALRERRDNRVDDQWVAGSSRSAHLLIEPLRTEVLRDVRQPPRVARTWRFALDGEIGNPARGDLLPLVRRVRRNHHHVARFQAPRLDLFQRTADTADHDRSLTFANE